MTVPYTQCTFFKKVEHDPKSKAKFRVKAPIAWCSAVCTAHSAGKCDVIGPKNHVPMGTKVEKVPNQLYQGHLHSMWTFRQKIILAPGVPMGALKVPRAHVLRSKKIFWAQTL